MKNKIVFIPGWMDTVKNRVDFDGLDIWLDDVDIDSEIDSEYVVGHSLGANWALLNWMKNKNIKLILFAPLVANKNIFIWFWRWRQFLTEEGTDMNQERMKCYWHFIRDFRLLWLLLNSNLEHVLDVIPKDSITIIRGKNDQFFCDDEEAALIRNKGIKIIELDNVGHNWNDIVRKETQRIIDN